MEYYDFIVIGAGPSGAMIAKELGERFRILILEKKKLPREKSCSGVLIGKSVHRVNDCFGDIPDYVTVSPRTTKGLCIQTSTNIYRFDDCGLNVNRSAFDYWLLKSNNSTNITVIDDARIIDYFEDDHVVLCFEKDGRKKKVISRVIIACDGINGISRGIAGLSQQKKIITYQRIVNGSMKIDKSMFYAFTSPLFSKYDAWLNFKEEKIIYGVIAYTRNEIEHYIARFESYLLEEFGLRMQNKEKDEYWCLPLITENKSIDYRKGRMFFCGESAGLLNPFGEGMSLALESAYQLATVIKYKSSIDDIIDIERMYIMAMKSCVSYMKRQWTMIQKIAPEFKRQIENASI